MSSAPFPIPAQVTTWIKSVFAEVNQRTSAKLSRIPNVHESSLDMTLIVFDVKVLCNTQRSRFFSQNDCIQSKRKLRLKITRSIMR